MFKITNNNSSSNARTGLLETAHGSLQTPFFMPDATRAVLKNISTDELTAVQLQAMVVNTYHLFLTPGMDILTEAGGVHSFMNTSLPLLSDSGGFQVFSLVHKSAGRMGKITDKGVYFKSPIDGTQHFLSPEKSIQIQFDLGVDMMVVLDDCRPNDNLQAEAEKAVERTVAWAKRCRTEFNKQIKKRKIAAEKKPLLFGVVQGGVFPNLRKKCAAELVEIGFDGLGFGARPIDEEGNFLAEIVQVTADAIPEDYLRFALGVGSPEDILRFYHAGWDMFDCVIPTREGRHGRLYFFDEKSAENIAKQNLDFYQVANISNSKFKKDFSPINEKSSNQLLQKYTKAYLHHLFKIGDPLGTRLASLNNLEFYMEFMNMLRSEN
jgi:queuine tRNA-ribosyltransferase